MRRLWITPTLLAVGGATVATVMLSVGGAFAYLDETTYVASGATDEAVGPHLSQDGRIVVFASNAALSPDANTGVRNVYARDLATGATELVSRGSLNGEGASGGSFETSLSADGRWVAYGSTAANLDADDRSAGSDIYVRDRLTGETMLASRAGGEAGAHGDDVSYQSSIAPDGGSVAFTSNAHNLTTGDLDGPGGDIFLRQLRSPFHTVLVSVPPIEVLSTAECQKPDRAAWPKDVCGVGGSRWPAASAAGNLVAFESDATKLATDGRWETDGAQDADIFVRDIDGQITTPVSVTAGGTFGNGASTRPVISDDGRWIVFATKATNLVAGDGNGAVSDIVLWNRTTGEMTRVTRSAAGGSANGPSSNPDISANGRYVAFESSATNLVAGGTASGSHVYLWERDSGTVRLVDRANGAAGAVATGNSTDAGISNDGTAVTFQSTAGNLSTSDSDGGKSVFVRDVLGTPRPVTSTTTVPTLPTQPTVPTVPTLPTVPTVTTEAGPVSVAFVSARATGVRWAGTSVAQGSVVINLTATGSRAVSVSVRGVGALTLTTKAGLQSVTLKLPKTIIPGAHAITVTDSADLIATTGSVTIPGPPQGIVKSITLVAKGGGRRITAVAVFTSRPAKRVSFLFRGPGGFTRYASEPGNLLVRRFLTFKRPTPGTWTVQVRASGVLLGTRRLVVR